MKNISKDLAYLALQKLIENHHQGILILNAKAQVIFVNSVYSEYSGFSKKKLRGQHMVLAPEIIKQLNESGYWGGKFEIEHRDLKKLEVWCDIFRIQDTSDFIDIFLLNEEKNKCFDFTELWKKAHTDTLTKLANLNALQDELNRNIQSQKPCAFVYIDLDGFKEINDLWGHDIGDKLLKHVARRFGHQNAHVQLFGRLHGDEFGAILYDKQSYQITAKKMLDKFKKPFIIEGVSMYVSACLGVSVFPKDAKNVKELINHADEAMQVAKSVGHRQMAFYDSVVHLAHVDTVRLTMEFKRGLQKKQFELYFQPIFKSDFKTIYKAETLIRWNHPDKGFLLPDYFLPLIQNNELIIELHKWIFQEVCRYLKNWKALHPQLQISINIPALLFQFPFSPFAYWKSFLKKYGISPHDLILEITEQSLFKPDTLIIKRIRALQKKGLQIAIDDFGTGFASLEYLNRLPSNYIKINRVFIRDVHRDLQKKIICASLIDLAHQLELAVIAEDVQNDKDYRMLQELGIDYVQGFLLARPMDAIAFEQRLKESKS